MANTKISGLTALTGANVEAAADVLAIVDTSVTTTKKILVSELLYVLIPSGTRMLFQQTSAPTGWTKEAGAAYNDTGLRFTTGTVGTGGATAFNTMFGVSKSTAAYTLTTTDIPAHTHTMPTSTGGGGPDSISGTPGTQDKATGSTGGGGSHSHTLNNFDLKWADSIIAQKD